MDHNFYAFLCLLISFVGATYGGLFLSQFFTGLSQENNVRYTWISRIYDEELDKKIKFASMGILVAAFVNMVISISTGYSLLLIDITPTEYGDIAFFFITAIFAIYVRYEIVGIKRILTMHNYTFPSDHLKVISILREPIMVVPKRVSGIVVVQSMTMRHVDYAFPNMK